MKIDLLLPKLKLIILINVSMLEKSEGGGGVKRRERKDTVFSYKYVQVFFLLCRTVTAQYV